MSGTARNGPQQTRADTGQMAMRDAERSGHAHDNQNIDFDNTINGVTIDQDDTGQRYEVPFGTEQRFQRDCVSEVHELQSSPHKRTRATAVSDLEPSSRRTAPPVA